MADSPNNVEKSYNKYIFKCVCIQRFGNRILSKYLICCLLREFYFSNAIELER